MMGSQRGTKRRLNLDADDVNQSTIFRFTVLLPDAMAISLQLIDPVLQMPFEEFIQLVKDEHKIALRQLGSIQNRHVNWSCDHLFLEDSNDHKIRDIVDLSNFKPHKCHILRLNDGFSIKSDTYDNMWDLTPDTELLRELPEEYTFETALADLIDNSLQAVWSNGKNERRLISVDILKDRISIFDSGPGMDDTDEKSIIKWGRMGASLHRSQKALAIGGKPPYLTPYFGMFGYGGPIASMYLGRRAVVSSKTKLSKKVYQLYLERDYLLKGSRKEMSWKTKGGIKNPSDGEIQKSPHGSFTKVDILDLKVKISNIHELQCKLKDIYFPYIQCDETSKTGRTLTPIQIQVNGFNLAEFDHGEVSVTNLHSCNGPEFVFQLHLSLKEDNTNSKSPGLKSSQEANARLRCIYFPISEGKESIEKILEKLDEQRCAIGENFETFSRVSIRRLGRLLPDARWLWLPFMDLRQKKGDKAHLLKRCCFRAKCCIEVDAGFNPTPSKTDLAHQNPFAIALKNFGSKTHEKVKDVNLDISREGKSLTFLQLEKEYLIWLLYMHESYDEEVDSGGDEPKIVVCPKNRRHSRFSSDVLRVHGILKRKGSSWQSGQRIKILKGACAGVHNNNVYATFEYLIIEGLPGDSGGQAWIICRPMEVAEKDGCLLDMKSEGTNLDIRSSLQLPITVIDSGKCLAIENSEWDQQLMKKRQKAPANIELLSEEQCHKLGIQGALPQDATVHAGHIPPREIVAVVRPGSYTSGSTSKGLDQKHILVIDSPMHVGVSYCSKMKNLKSDQEHKYSAWATPSYREGFSGLYIFNLDAGRPELFLCAGVYRFAFSLKDSSCEDFVKEVVVKGSSKINRWELLSDNKHVQSCRVRVGTRFVPFQIGCFDSYGNHIPFKCVPRVKVELKTSEKVLSQISKVKTKLSRDKLILEVSDIVVESRNLDEIRPNYKANLVVHSEDDPHSVSIQCTVSPGSLKNVKIQPPEWRKSLYPGLSVKEFVLEMFDGHGNHITERSEVQLKLVGLEILDQLGSTRKVDSNGCINLGGILKVTAGFGESGSISVSCVDKLVFSQKFQTCERQLTIASTVPELCNAGSELENLVFEVVDPEGHIDETIHDDEKTNQSHAIKIKADHLEDTARYIFVNGCCTVPSVRLPTVEGRFCLTASHTRYPDLKLSITLCVGKAPKVEFLHSSSPRSDRQQFLPLQTPSPINHDVENHMLFDHNSMQKLENDVHKYGERIGTQEQMLQNMHNLKAEKLKGISQLEASIKSFKLNYLENQPTKEDIVEEIKRQSNSAAAILFHLDRDCLFEGPQFPNMEGIIGIVVLLGVVCSNKLSRIFAEYLGEDQMLAVVCNSYEAAFSLEEYDGDGKVDCMRALHGEASALGKSITGRFTVMCLEDIRPFSGDVESGDLQRKLVIVDPSLPAPSGFLGYAVNLVNLDVNHLDTKTAKGYGLRETLLYCLFGFLQVYDTREHMMEARPYIRDGAVSLDGGILRENGMVSLGYWDPKVRFPVIKSEPDIPVSPEEIEKVNKLQNIKAELQDIEMAIENLNKKHQTTSKKFKKHSEKLKEVLNNLEPALRDSSGQDT